MAVYSSTKPEKLTAKADEFASLLSTTSWYTLGVFLGAEFHELLEINRNYKDEGTMRCLIALYQCLEKKGEELLAWKTIAKACRKMNEHALADRIHSEYIAQQTAAARVAPVLATGDGKGDGVVIIMADKIEEIANEYELLLLGYTELLRNIKSVFTQVNLGEVQDLLNWQRGVPRLPPDEATVELVFDRVKNQCSLLNLRILRILVEKYIRNESLLADVDGFISAVNTFKDSANMTALVQLIQQNRQQIATVDGHQKIVQLKVREFWVEFTVKQFETLLNELFQTLYDIMTHITIKKGCICLTWIIPDIDTTKLVPVLPLELIRLIGVIYLHIGSDIIYNIEGEGCESIEAAMLQAIELKNTRAIELLLAVGCNPEVATYNGDNAVTNILNIRAIESKESSSSGSSHSVDHVCILGHNKYVEAIFNPSKEPECGSYCSTKKMNKQLHQEIEQLEEKIKQKDGENILLKENNEIFIKESREKDAKIESLKTAGLAIANPSKEPEYDSSSSAKKMNKQLCHEIQELKQEIKLKDAENTLLKRTNEILIKEKEAATKKLLDDDGLPEEPVKRKPIDSFLQPTDVQEVTLIEAGHDDDDDDDDDDYDDEMLTAVPPKFMEQYKNKVAQLKMKELMIKGMLQELEQYKAFSSISESRVPTLYDDGSHHYPPVDIRMTHFDRRRTRHEYWYSPSFYSHPRGYKLCIRLAPAGQDEGEGTHLSMFVHVMSGDHDDTLPWPFRGVINVQLRNQRGDHTHIKATVRYDESTSKDASDRVISGFKMASGTASLRGVGKAKFISYEDLVRSDLVKMTEYLKDDEVIIRVTKVTMDQPIAYVAEIIVPNYTKLKDKNQKWESPPFYTRPNNTGYKFLLAVHANGKGRHKGSWVSIYTHLMRGEHDDELKFPFRGIITIQLVNQRENRDHVVSRIQYTDESDPTGKRGGRVNLISAANLVAGRSYGGWGYPTFVRHKYLNTYLTENDELVFRITNVEDFSL